MLAVEIDLGYLVRKKVGVWKVGRHCCFPFLPWFALSGNVPNPFLDLHILSLPKRGWPCHTVMAKWIPIRGPLKKKKKKRPFLAWNPVV